MGRGGKMPPLLERRPAIIDCPQPDITRFLIPAATLAAAARGDKGSSGSKRLLFF